MNRKEFLRNLGFGSLVLSNISCQDYIDVSPLQSTDFKNPLNIPETINGIGNLDVQILEKTLIDNKKTSLYLYGNSVLAPLIRVQKGASIKLKLSNQLAYPTNIHWHGLLVPAAMDGHPDQMIMPDHAFDYQFVINQQAGTNWYHPHPHEMTGEQVVRGLAGLFIVETPEEKALNLPSGAYEIPLIIQDKKFDQNGNIKYNPKMNEKMNGFMGETILVNNTISPFLNVSTRFYRFRVLNGSSARIYNLTLSDNQDFYIIGADGGILPNPEKQKSVLIASGERLDILIDFSKYSVGSEVFLESKTFGEMGDAQGKQAFNLLKFAVTKQETNTFQLSTKLIAVPKLSNSTKTRSFEIVMKMLSSSGMHKINGKTYKADRIDETVNFGTTETWEFDNSKEDQPHPMHIHGVQFQVVSRTGGRNTILSHEKGWKDTVLVAPKEKVQVIVKFETKGKFVFHCHNLEHEDDGMMLNYEVV